MHEHIQLSTLLFAQFAEYRCKNGGLWVETITCLRHHSY